MYDEGERLDLLMEAYACRDESARRAEGFDAKHGAHQWRLKGVLAERIGDLIPGKRETVEWYTKCVQDCEEALERRDNLEGFHIEYILHRVVEAYFKLFKATGMIEYKNSFYAACEDFFKEARRGTFEYGKIYDRIIKLSSLMKNERKDGRNPSLHRNERKKRRKREARKTRQLRKRRERRDREGW